MVFHLLVVCVFSSSAECSNYRAIDQHTRGTNFYQGNWCDFKDDLGWEKISAGEWFRFTYPGNTMVPRTNPGGWKCYTKNTGWQNYESPTSLYETTSGNMCFSGYDSNWNKLPCKYSAAAETTLCYGYYVYRLTGGVVYCPSAFCARAYDGPTFPTIQPTSSPTILPTIQPSNLPSVQPTTAQPTIQPSPQPTTAQPTIQPSMTPTSTSANAKKQLLTYVNIIIWAMVGVLYGLLLFICIRRRNKKLYGQTAGLETYAQTAAPVSTEAPTANPPSPYTAGETEF